MINGKQESVRMLLIDTPETVHPSQPVQPFGKEASDFVKELMPIDKTVQVELDVGERDKYGRLLAYVWVDGKMVNELLLEKGFARVAYIYTHQTLDMLMSFTKYKKWHRKRVWAFGVLRIMCKRMVLIIKYIIKVKIKMITFGCIIKNTHVSRL